MIHELAPAKINLYLEVLRRRPDGYHDIDTLFQQISLADEILIRARRGAGPDRLKIRGAKISAGPDNLVLRAVAAVRQAGYSIPPLEIRLKKNVPVGAGLGGGSSDAAAMLRALKRLIPARRRPRFWRQAPRIAAALGADVPFFLRGGAAVGRGTGTRLSSLRRRGRGKAPFWIVIVFPGVFVSTPWAYRCLRRRFPLTNPQRSRTLYVSFNRSAPVGKWAPLLFNRFEEVVLPAHPEVAKAKAALEESGCAAALMSGSGSSVFGIVKSEASGRKVIQNLARRRRWKVWLTRPAL